MSDQRNLIVAIALSVLIILGFQLFYEMPRMEQQRQAQQAAQQQAGQAIDPATGEPATQGAVLPEPGVDPGVAAPTAPGLPAALGRDQALAQAPRVPIDNGQLHGSIALQGGRIDDLTLADYHLTPDSASPEIELLNPLGSANPYFAEFGWVPADAGVKVPGPDAVWEPVEGSDVLGADNPLRLRWDNGEGLVFNKTVALDEHYMFTVERTVSNNTEQPVTLFPYSLISRWGTPDILGFYILHEGLIGAIDGNLREIDYDDVLGEPAISEPTTGGWAGITDKYWLTAMVPPQDEQRTVKFREVGNAAGPRYQVDYLGQPVAVPPGGTVETTDRLFAGAKRVELLDAYAEEFNIPVFDRAIDFGWFYFLTKPIFLVLNFFYGFLGNYGLAILLLTLLVKIALFPLTDKSYRAMSQMKKLQPEMTRLREKHGDDRQKMQQELMALYKKEKVNPLAGCLPILVQMPVFFALYKVLFVSIEMRHAPFYGWINDLSAPDPTSLFNLFGLLPFAAPAFLQIGVWPILMGLTMWLQQRLNPQPADPTQAKILAFLPLIFVFLFATFPAGLVIYWTWNNLLSIAQQRYIMWRMGVKPG